MSTQQVEQNADKMSDNDLASYKSQINTGSSTVLFRGVFANGNTFSNKVTGKIIKSLIQFCMLTRDYASLAFSKEF